MTKPERKVLRCAIYTRKSTEHNLDLEFNSLDAQREACEAYIKSQAHEGWRLLSRRYDDAAFSGASLERPALQQLLEKQKQAALHESRHRRSRPSCSTASGQTTAASRRRGRSMSTTNASSSATPTGRRWIFLL
jgi:DNA invertase Pin-like site-specific DNA recombinase